MPSPSGIAVATGVFTIRMPATDNWLGVPRRHLRLVRFDQFHGHPAAIEYAS